MYNSVVFSIKTQNHFSEWGRSDTGEFTPYSQDKEKTGGWNKRAQGPRAEGKQPCGLCIWNCLYKTAEKKRKIVTQQ